MNPYLADILAQPSALHDALTNYSPQIVERIRKRLQRADFDRIIITGMGSSSEVKRRSVQKHISICWRLIYLRLFNSLCAFEDMHAADFRHGPLELVSSLNC